MYLKYKQAFKRHSITQGANILIKYSNQTKDFYTSKVLYKLAIS